MDAEERVERAVGTRQLTRDDSRGAPRVPRAAVALDRPADDAELRKRPDELERELGALPIVVDDRQNALVAERAHPVAQRALLLAERVVEQEDVLGAGARGVAVRGRRRGHCRLRYPARSPSSRTVASSSTPS